MRANEWLMCGATKRHLGWGLTSLRTAQPSMCNVVSRQHRPARRLRTDNGGNTTTAAWEPAMVSWWEGWWNLLGGRAAPGAPVTVVSRRADFLDAFVGRHGGRVYTCAWTPRQGWRGWWRVGNAVFPQGAMINAVSRSQDHLDIFGTDASGRVLTAAWEPAFTDGWHGWWEIRGGRARPGAPVTAVSRSANKLDVFVTGTDGGAYTAAWEPGVHRRLARLVADPQRGVPAGRVPRRRHAAAPTTSTCSAPTRAATSSPPPGSPRSATAGTAGGRSAAAARSRARPSPPSPGAANKLDMFVIGTDNVTYTAAWEPAFTDGWHGWWNLNGGRAAHGSFITRSAGGRTSWTCSSSDSTAGLLRRVAPGRAWGGWWPMGT